MYPVAILAGGLATRMGPLTAATPKALLDINGQPFLAHQLRLLAAQGIAEVVLCVGHFGEQIAAYVGDGSAFGLRIRCSYDGPTLLGTAGALKRALPLLGNRFFVMYGDSYLLCDFHAVQAAHEGCGKLALMTAYRNEGRFDASNLILRNGQILLYEKTCRRPEMRHIDYGLGAFDALAFADVSEDRPTCLSDLYRSLLAAGQLAAYEVHERFYEIGSVDGLRDTRHYLTQAGCVSLPRKGRENDHRRSAPIH